MGVIRQMNNQLTQMLDYGNPVLDAPPFDPSVFPEAAPSMDLEGSMAMDPSMDSMADQMEGAPMPNLTYQDPMENQTSRNDMMALLSQRAAARKANSEDFMAAAMNVNKR